VHEKVSSNEGMQKAKWGRAFSDERLNGEPHFIERMEKESATFVVCK
jgi:hypothetical protein